MSNFNSLSQRVHDVQTRFQAKRVQEREQKEQLHSLVEAIERDAEQFNSERETLRAEIQTLKQRVVELEEQNQQLEAMLGGLLEALEAGGEEDIGRALEELEQRVTAIAQRRAAEPAPDRVEQEPTHDEMQTPEEHLEELPEVLPEEDSGEGSLALHDSELDADDLGFDLEDETEEPQAAAQSALEDMVSELDDTAVDEGGALREDEVFEEDVLEDEILEDDAPEDGVLEDGILEDVTEEDVTLEDEVLEDEVLEDEPLDDEILEVDSDEEAMELDAVDEPQAEQAEDAAPGSMAEPEAESDTLGLQDAQSLIKALARIDAGLEERLGVGSESGEGNSAYAETVTAAKRKAEIESVLEGEELAQAAATGVRDILRRVQKRSQEVLNADSLQNEVDIMVTDILDLEESDEIREDEKDAREAPRRAAS